jgi:hypothetical protein
MKPIQLIRIYQTARSIADLRHGANIRERFGLVKFTDANRIAETTESIELLTTRSRLKLDDGNLKAYSSLFRSFETICDEASLKLSSKSARASREKLGNSITTFTDAESALSTLEEFITSELEQNLFFAIPPERAAFYGDSELFGMTVNARFPACQFDIEEAGCCYAAGRGTACAFHLMRVMEVAVREFGTALGVGLTNEKNWQKILDEINKAIKALPQKDPRTIALSQAAAHLYNVKVAWRNPTMHPTIKYTLEEAGDLITAVKAFMCELVQVI